MKIYYQWEPGSYSHLAARNIEKNISVGIDDILWVHDFDTVWEHVEAGHIWVLPLENSYAGTIHQNVYNFLLYNHKIIGEYDFEVEHCLLSLEDDITNITEVYSHPQALSQTHKYTHKFNWEVKPFGDTAWAAKMILDKNKRWAAAIASDLAGEIYKLNTLEKNIQDQEWNTTKFIIIVAKPKIHSVTFSEKKWKTSVFFEAWHKPASLYNCLWVFAKRGINLSKIESIPLKNQRFTYGFWIRFDGNIEDSIIRDALEDLKNYSKDIRILWEY